MSESQYRHHGFSQQIDKSVENLKARNCPFKLKRQIYETGEKLLARSIKSGYGVSRLSNIQTFSA
jgi:hypothetical protein